MSKTLPVRVWKLLILHGQKLQQNYSEHVSAYISIYYLRNLHESGLSVGWILAQPSIMKNSSPRLLPLPGLFISFPPQ